MRLLDRILTCIDKMIPSSQDDSTKEWEKVTEEGKALREQIEKLSERVEQPADSIES